MIYWATGNPFDRDVDIRVNTVNCVGVMGKGVALEFKRRYPQMFFAYSEICRGRVLKPGNLHIWYKPERQEWIINFATKDHWRDFSRYEWIRQGLISLRRYLNQYGHQTVTLPALGCGHGGLDWRVVKPMIEKALSSVGATVYVYPPDSSR